MPRLGQPLQARGRRRLCGSRGLRPRPVLAEFDYLAHGGTDAGRFHLWDKGVPSLYIGLPARYVHSAASVIHRDDLENAARLVAAVAKKLDAVALKRIRGF